VPIRDFANQEQTEKAYAQAARIKGTPTFIFYDLAGHEIVRIFGTIETPDEFLLLGRFVASGAYKTRDFAQYKSAKPRL
jgi:thioredoxin-related protein